MEWGWGSICSENNTLFSDTIDHRIKPGLKSYLLLNLASFVGYAGWLFLPLRKGAARGASVLTHHSLPSAPSSTQGSGAAGFYPRPLLSH